MRRQVAQIMIVRWFFHCHRKTNNKCQADTTKLRKDWCDIVAELVRIRASVAGLVLSFLAAVHEASQ